VAALGPVPDQGVNRFGAIRANPVAQLGVACGEFIGRQQLGNSRSADTYSAVGAPSRLELEGAAARIGLGALDAEPVEGVDHSPVARVADTIAAIIGRRHAHAGLVVIPQGLSPGVSPGLVAKAHALADGTGGAGDREPGRPTQVPSITRPAARDGKARHGTVGGRGAEFVTRNNVSATSSEGAPAAPCPNAGERGAASNASSRWGALPFRT
jgi:hypothetical protein